MQDSIISIFINISQLWLVSKCLCSQRYPVVCFKIDLDIILFPLTSSSYGSVSISLSFNIWLVIKWSDIFSVQTTLETTFKNIFEWKLWQLWIPMVSLRNENFIFLVRTIELFSHVYFFNKVCVAKGLRNCFIQNIISCGHC